jgi:hypothetical protein
MKKESYKKFEALKEELGKLLVESTHVFINLNIGVDGYILNSVIVSSALNNLLIAINYGMDQLEEKSYKLDLLNEIKKFFNEEIENFIKQVETSE